MSDPQEELVDETIGHATVFYGAERGKYPHANTLVVAGTEEALAIDPSLGLIPRRGRLPRVDRVLNSHCHEDHTAGNHLFPDVPLHLHTLDAPGVRSLDDFMAIYGFPPEIDAAFRPLLTERFHFTARSDAQSFEDGDLFDLGGVRVTVIHTPGHTRGHCCFLVEPDSILYVSDIDLSSFGPYYGDAWSSLEDFERSIAAVRAIEARWYVTSHHVGTIEGHTAFAERLDRFAAKIAERERRLLEFLAEPRTLAEVAEHRFVYRPGDQVLFADPVERRSMGQHIERLLRARRVDEVEPGRYRAA